MSDSPVDDTSRDTLDPASGDSKLNINYQEKDDQTQDGFSTTRPPNPYRITTTAPGPPVPHANSYLNSMPKVDSNTTKTSGAPLGLKSDASDSATSPPRDDALPKPLVRLKRQSAQRQFLHIFILSYTALQAVNALGVLLRARKYVLSFHSESMY